MVYLTTSKPTVQYKKKKNKKHQKVVKTLNLEMKVKGLILKEEAIREGFHTINTSKYLENMSIRAKKPHIKHIKDYMELTYLKTWLQH